MDDSASLNGGDDGVRPAAIVAVCAVPGGQPSLDRFLSALPAGFNAAVVVLCPVGGDASRPPLTRERLAETTGRDIGDAVDGMLLEAGSIVLAPPACMLTVASHRLRVRPGESLSVIDTFAVSIANEEQSATALVMLAGLGDAGALGVAAVKAAGGLTFAETQDGLTAAYGGVADFIMPAELIPARIASHLNHMTRLGVTEPARWRAERLRPHVSAVADVLLQHTGHDFHGYKERTFVRRLARRMQVRETEDIDTYVAALRDDIDEVNALFQDLLIGVTQFFRDPAEFEVLGTAVVPGLLRGKAWGDKLRIWVPGCSTGEEAYSLAILVKEHLEHLGAPPALQIFATDIDARALVVARAGRYAENISQHISPERLSRWFSHEGGTFVVSRELRDACVFSVHNILRDPPFSRIDLISSRNLLIYLGADLQSRVIPLFHFALRPGGALFLGPAENISRHSKLFEPMDRRHRIFRRQDVAVPPRPELPLMSHRQTGFDRQPARRAQHPTAAEMAAEAARIAASHAPPFVVVDDGFDVLHFSGGMGRFLEPAAGQATLALLNLVHRELRLDLRALLHRVVASGQPACSGRLPLVTEAGRSSVTLVVERMPQTTDQAVRLVVVFRESVDGELGGAEPITDDQFVRLDAELQVTKERLQSVIEELETTNEELKASNEEYQSVNEELQSTNEELETSKEELQSLNEELQTVNGELASRVADLARANSDLRNVLESTQIAIVFLDNDLQIKNFTPAVTEVVHLIDTDIGRPINHIALQVSYPELPADVRRVLRTLASVERDVANPANGKRYLVRVLPYRNVNNFIGGAVLTFLDVTATYRAEQALRDSEERFRIMASTVPTFLFITDGAGAWEYVNPPFYATTGLPEGASLGEGWLDAVHPDDREQAKRVWQEAALDGSTLEQECRMGRAGGAWFWVLMRAVPQVAADGQVTAWFGSCTDIDERRRAERRQRLLLAELQHRVKNILAVVRSLLARTLESSKSLDDFAAHLSGRIDALARTQSVLSRTADEAVVLEQLVHEELAAHGGHDERQIEVDGPAVLLPGKVAETLGLAMHELTTNALKYGALSVPMGRVQVRWRTYPAGVTVVPAKRLTLEWLESGVPITDLHPNRSGFGRELIESGLPFELGAQTLLEFRPGGVRCVIELTIAEAEHGERLLLDPAE